MLKGKWKLLICGLLIVCIGFIASNNVFAAINEDYLNDMPVADANLEDKIANSPLLEAIGSLIYALGSLMEWVLGKVFQLITGSNMFPWADAILFNAVPFLDVNIFTAAEGSLISKIYEFLTGTYYSLLTLASTFFGIAVMFSAIKLAITAIAEDKAKYKKAIVDWILGLVMLWGMHFFISFVLYLNEQLVVVASGIVSESVKEAGDNISALADTSEYNEKIVGNFVNLMESKKITLGNLLGLVATAAGVILAVIVVVVVNVGTLGVGTVIAGLVASTLIIGGSIFNTAQATEYLKYAVDFQKITEAVEKGKTKEAEKNWKTDDSTYINMTNWMFSKTDSIEINGVEHFYSPIDICAALLKSDAYTSKYFKNTAESGGFWTFKKAGTPAQVARLYLDASTLVGGIDVTLNGKNSNSTSKDTYLGYSYYKLQLEEYNSIPTRERKTSGSDKNYDPEMVALYTAYCNIFEQYVLKQKSKTNILYNLATYFKETAFEVSETGWKANKAVVQNAIMYVLLVAYSVVFFISYTKRLFYVIMLILMAPIVVVFDFFMKFGR